MGILGPQDLDSLTLDLPRYVHERMFRSSFPEFPQVTWEGAAALGTRTQSAWETGVPQPSCVRSSLNLCRGDSSPWRDLFVASRALHHSSLSPAKSAAWCFRSPTLICLESADPVHVSSQAGNCFFSSLPVCTTTHRPHWALLATCSEAILL